MASGQGLTLDEILPPSHTSGEGLQSGQQAPVGCPEGPPMLEEAKGRPARKLVGEGSPGTERRSQLGCDPRTLGRAQP